MTPRLTLHVSIAALVAAALAADAAAKMTLRIRVLAGQPRAGAIAVIELRPYTASATGAPRPWRVRYPFDLRAAGPAHASLRVRPHPHGDGDVYRARVVFPRRGWWRIRVENFRSRTGICCGATVTVRVR